jgi:DNA polymerase-3 subunit gamma/tau
MGYEVTANRKRPQSFEEMVGQDFVVATLKNSIEQGRIAHAYLFAGPRGIGKTSAARILAKSLNCEKGPTGTPCGTCPSCREIAQGNSLDVIEIDGASNTSVNDVRAIKDEVLFAPNSGRYKIYIIDEVHMLSNSAFNALLKTIEEPPPYIVFVFATTEVHKVPATIRSRCQQFNFRLIGPEQIKNCLRQVVQELNIPAEEPALFWMAKEATGSLRDAYTLLDQVISFSGDGIRLEKIREKLGLAGIDQINQLGLIISQGDKKKLLEAAAEILDRGVPVEQLASDLVDYYRNLLFLKTGIRREALLSFAPDDYSPQVVAFFNTAQLEKALELLLELHRNLKLSINPRFDLELVLCQLAGLKELIQPAEVVQALQRLKASLPSGSSSSGPSPRPGSPAPAGKAEARKPSVAEAAEEAAEETARESAPEDPSLEDPAPSGLRSLIEAMRKEKLALAASLEKAESWQLAEGELRLTYRPKDRYSGEHVLKEKEAVLKLAPAVFGPGTVSRLQVAFSGAKGSPVASRNEQAEMVKKIFRGEVVKGE